MASPQQPPRRRRRLPPVSKSQALTTTTIHTLGDDLLLDIFLRLPSLPSLVRAALACRAFLAAIRSSPAFRRCFRALHPHPLIGFFFETCSCDVPSFSPIRRRSDPDLAAAVRGADVFLTHLPYREDADPEWKIVDCRGGCLLLLNDDAGQIAAYNPLTRALHLLPTPRRDLQRPPRQVRPPGFLLASIRRDPRLLPRYLLVPRQVAGARRRLFIGDQGVADPPVTAPAQPSGKKHWLRKGKLANGNLYWAHVREAYMVVLDTTTLQFSFMDLPHFLNGQIHLCKIGETKDGKLCMVITLGFTLFILFRRLDTDGVEKWVVHDGFLLHEEILQATEGTRDDDDELKLMVWSVMDGIVYLSPFICRGDPHLPCWFLSFCLETRKLEKLFHRTFDNSFFPYIMAWPPSLVDSDASP